MGRTVITPPPPGEACLVCWGSGKPFGAGPTPSVVTVVFADIEVIVLGGPNTFLNLTLKLVQLFGLPCIFQGSAGGYTAAWSQQFDGSTVILTFDSDRFFTSEPASQCAVNFVGSDTISLPFAKGGSCSIFI